MKKNNPLSLEEAFGIHGGTSGTPLIGNLSRFAAARTLKDELDKPNYDLSSFQVNKLILFIEKWVKKHKTSGQFILGGKSYIDVKELEEFLK